MHRSNITHENISKKNMEICAKCYKREVIKTKIQKARYQQDKKSQKNI